MSLRILFVIALTAVTQACAGTTPRRAFPQPVPAIKAGVGAKSELLQLGPGRSRSGALMLVPSAVARVVPAAPGAISTILVGAIFATGAGAESHEGNLALIFEAPEGGLEEILRGTPTLRIAVDESAVFDGSVEGLSLLVTARTSVRESLML
jgi:hypothetical protein